MLCKIGFWKWSNETPSVHIASQVLKLDMVRISMNPSIKNKNREYLWTYVLKTKIEKKMWVDYFHTDI